MIIMDKSGHLVSTESLAELHDFAKDLGLRPEWFQVGDIPHYDVTTTRRRNVARELGAKIVSKKVLVRMAVRS